VHASHPRIIAQQVCQLVEGRRFVVDREHPQIPRHVPLTL
jgi:hypothetical protein